MIKFCCRLCAACSEYFERYKTALHFQCSKKEMNNEVREAKQLAINKSVRSLTLHEVEQQQSRGSDGGGSPLSSPGPGSPADETGAGGGGSGSHSPHRNSSTSNTATGPVMDVGVPNAFIGRSQSMSATDNYAFEAMTYKPIMDSERLMNEAATAIHNAALSPSEKHVHILLKTSALSRHLGGSVGILCKSGTCVCLCVYICRHWYNCIGR
jgi:hypothetical protein